MSQLKFVARSIALVWLLAAGAAVARADVAVLVEEPYGELGAMSPSGHAAVYFNNICAASLTQLRRCHAGEAGVVLARYDGIGDHDWIAIPLVPYLYAVDDVADVPTWVDHEQVDRIREQYREEHLQALAPDVASPVTGALEPPKGNWYELAGSAYDRRLYGFRVKTTAAEDARVIALLNDHPNHERYNGLFRNCADFVRTIVNLYYPKAIRRNYVSDLGLTSPKQLAHGLTKYAKKHPEVHLTTFTVLQVPGTLGRSHRPKCLMETFATSLRYAVPLTVVQPIAMGVAVTAYLTRGRFPMPKDSTRWTPVEIGALTDTAVPLPAPGPEFPLTLPTAVNRNLIRTHAPEN